MSVPPGARLGRTPPLLQYWLLGAAGLRWAVAERRRGLLVAVLGGGAAAWYAAGRGTAA